MIKVKLIRFNLLSRIRKVIYFLFLNLQFYIDINLMECLYFKNLTDSSDLIKLTPEECRHAKSLRLRTGEKVLITNGTGLMAESFVNRIEKNDYFISITELFEMKGESPFHFDLAVGILDNKERFEFVIEKATELGVRRIFPLVSKFSNKKNINIDRLNLKALSAIKQCQRSLLPMISKPIDIIELTKLAEDYHKIILGDIRGSRPELKNKNNLLFIVGGEGGFSEVEITQLKKFDNIELWNIGERRLRGETAAVALLSAISFL